MALRRLMEEICVESKDCAALGGSNMDATMFKERSLSTAFNPKEDAAEEKKDYVVYGKRLL